MKKNQDKLPKGQQRVPYQTAPSPIKDPLAEAEKQELQKRRSEHYRDQTSRTILALCMWILMVMVFIIVAGAVSTLGYHLLTPNEWHWLSTDELQDIKNSVLSGAIVGLGTSYIRKYLDSH